jgi:hypothetical protein
MHSFLSCTGQRIVVMYAFLGLNVFTAASTSSTLRHISERSNEGETQQHLAKQRSSRNEHKNDKVVAEPLADDTNWYDCSLEMGIENLVTFSDVQSIPSIVTPTSGQTILKTILYDVMFPDDSSEPSVLERIAVDFHQYYKLFDRTWITFLVVRNVDECKEHTNLCPLAPGEEKQLTTVHPPLNHATPYGWYRSRQIYKDTEKGTKIGCVDMEFQYLQHTHEGVS